MPRSFVVAALLPLVATAVSLLATGSTQAQPAVSAVSPGAVRPGTTTELTLTGQNLADPLVVWTSFPAQVEVLPGEPTSRKLKLTLDANTLLGIGGLVVANGGGMSLPQFVMIDDLASIGEAPNNHAAATPQELTLPIAVDGVANGQQFDYFRVHLSQGQRVSLDVVGSRLGSDFDPVLRVLDASGRELALADDDEALGADARLVFTAPATAPYTIELRDNRYKAGGRYRLRVGDLPLVTTAFPLAGKLGGPLQTSLTTLDGEALAASLALPASPFDTTLSACVRRGGVLAGFATIRGCDLPTLVEPSQVANTNDGMTITLPGVINGRLSEPGQRDRYSFAAKKGERWNFRAVSRSVGSPTVLAFRVLNAAGGVVAATAPTEAEEELLVFTAPEDGTYRLEADDLLGRGGAAYAYAIEATAGPFFNLVAKNDPNTRFQHLLAPGGAFIFDVQVQRNGYDGAIQFSAATSRNGFRLEPSVIPEKVNELRVYVFPPADFHAGEIVDLRIVGKANVGPREHSAVARNLVQLRAARPLQPHPPGWLDGAVLVAYADHAPFYTLAPAMAEASVAQGAQVMVPFAFERTNMNFKDVPLTLMITGLPAGVTHEVKRNGTGPKESYEVTFKAAANAAEGKHPIHWRGYVEFQGRGRVVEGDLQLVITKPAQ